MMRYSIDEIARITGSQLFGDRTLIIRQLCTDTRRIDLPAQSLFVALTGPSHDGHRFLAEAFASGIHSFLVGKLPDNPDQFPGATFLLSGDPLTAIQKLAAWHRKQFNGQLIAITGSNGKTIIKEWLSQILQVSFRVIKSPKSYNSQLGVPLSVLNIAGDEQYAVIEAGISKPGEMAGLQNILDPDIGIISNIGDAHQENFRDLHEKTLEKLFLFRNCKKIFYCLDQELIHTNLQFLNYPGSKYCWSRTGPANLWIRSESVMGSACKLSGIFLEKEVNLIIPFTDPASVENLIHIWLFLLTMGFDQNLLQTQVSKLEPIRMRLEQKAGINRCTLINDYYNSDILSFKTAIDLLFQQTSQSRKTIILSDILQTGQSEKILYGEISRLLQHHDLYRLIGIGPAICRNKDAFVQKISTWSSTAEFLATINPDEFQDEAILLKGARSFRFEQIGSILEARIHSTTLEIRMNDVRHNLEQYRMAVGSGVRIMAMVKAFAYGSGSIEIASFLVHERVDYLGVAFVDEGMEIRRAGINIPVMVMNPDFQQSEQIIDFHLEPEIYNWKGLRSFCSTLKTQGINPYPVHLKIDTGMHRLGFDYGETELLSEFLNNHPEIFVRSVFSHLASSEDPEFDDFTKLQIRRFSDACNSIKKLTGSSFLRHILNSSGIERFPEARFDMVRLGIGLHGIDTAGSLNLKPIATLKTVISQIHLLNAGESVGYGRQAILKTHTRVGIIPIGYADGIDRRLGNRNWHMLFKNKPVPTIGNICMDMTMLDLNGLDALEGDEIVVFGPLNPVKLMAEVLNTIPYEVLTSISPRVKRIFQFD